MTMPSWRIHLIALTPPVFWMEVWGVGLFFVYLLCVRELGTQWGPKSCGLERYWILVSDKPFSMFPQPQSIHLHLTQRRFFNRKSETKVIHPSRFGSQPTSKRKSLGLFPARNDLFKWIFTVITVCIFQLSVASFCDWLQRSPFCACRFVCYRLNTSANSVDAVTISKMAASFGCHFCLMAPDKLSSFRPDAPLHQSS